VKKFLKITFVIILIAGIFFIAGAMFFASELIGANKVSFDKNILLGQTAKMHLYDNNETLIETASVNNPVISLKELPDTVKNAFIAIEDKRFYAHNGLNVKRMLKAIYTNLTSGYAKEGASTISQQLIKNTYLNHEKTLDRKIKEILLTHRLEEEFSKDDILESYLNVIYFGNSSYGIESASQNYFNKNAKDLSLSEAATLAGLIKSPLTFSPIYNYEKSVLRRNVVLSEMQKDGFITREQYEKAKQDPLHIVRVKQQFSKRRIYEKAALQEASSLLNLSEKDVATSNLKVFTYMDKTLQDECEQLVLEEAYYHKNEFGNTADSACVVIHNHTNGVEAFCGNSNYNLLTMKRLPGSAIKPILVYAPALEYGKISPTTPILDEKINIAGYEPHNVGGKFYGWVTARETVEKSLNIPAIKILQYVGMEKAKAFSEKAGIAYDKKDTGYSIALGGFTEGVSLIQLTNSYTPFATGGQYQTAHFVKRIEDQNGKVLYENKQQKQQIMSAETAYLMTDMLISGVKQGTSHKLNTLEFEVAGKTGTVGLHNSNKNTDAWSIGYTTQKTVGVWLGNSTGEETMHLDASNNGGTYASMLLRDVLEVAHTTSPITFDVPKNVITCNIDEIALKQEHAVKLASENVPKMYQLSEVFDKKFAPKQVSTSFDLLQKPELFLKVDDRSAVLSFLASPYCSYELYKVQEDETVLLETFKNKQHLITITDENLEEDVLYEYYLIATQKNYVNDEIVKSAKSSSVKALIAPKEPYSFSNTPKSTKKRKRFILF
jgi:1A family penicillin-binding protein